MSADDAIRSLLAHDLDLYLEQCVLYRQLVREGQYKGIKEPVRPVDPRRSIARREAKALAPRVGVKGARHRARDLIGAVALDGRMLYRPGVGEILDVY